MRTINFNLIQFREMFPVFSNTFTYPDALIVAMSENATSYVSNQTGGCFVGKMKPAQQVLALNLMTAHLSYLMGLVNTQQSPGIVQAATIDKVSVTLVPPPEKNQWQWWLNQSPFGQQLLALLQVAAAAGYFIPGGLPARAGFRT